MKTILSLVFASTLLAAAGPVAAQTTTGQLVGGWSLVSLVTDTADGRIEPFGPTPLGYISFEANGRFAAQFLRHDLPKVAANNRLKATPEENIAIAQGSVAFFGKWSLVDEKTGEIRVSILGSSYPNWSGSEQKRFMKVEGDSLTITNPVSPAAGVSTVALMRVK